MFTNRGRSLIAATVVLWGLGRALGIAELSMAAVATLVLLLLAVLFTRLASTTVEVRRVLHPARLFHGASGEVEIQVRNVGRLPTAVLQLRDTAPPTIAESSGFVASPVPAGGTVALRYPTVGHHRGRHRIGPAELRLRDPFGVAQRQLVVGGRDELVVYPPVWELPAGMPLAGHLGVGSDGAPRRLAAGDDLANVREYVRGDDLRKVHWRSTAHRGKLMVRQDESPQSPRATLVLDTGRDRHHGVGPSSSLETAIASAASIAYHLAERSYATRLLTGPVAVPPQPLPWQLVLEQLAELEPGRGALTPLWVQLASGVGGEGTLLAVVTVPSAAELRHMVRAGRLFAGRIGILVDTASFGRRQGDPEDAARTSAALRAAGWRVGTLAAGQRLDQLWRRIMVQRAGVPASVTTSVTTSVTRGGSA